MLKKWIWISGWGIQPERFQAAAQAVLPEYQHYVLVPYQNALADALSMKPDRIGGYSLGSLLLLKSIDQIPSALQPVALAPITAFCSEHKTGGTTETKALEMIQDRLQKAPIKALKLFYRLAGLTNEPCDHLPYAIERLTWGLEALKTVQAEASSLEQVSAYCGSEDVLMNYTGSDWPTSNRTTMVTASHDYMPLLKALLTSPCTR